MTYYNAVKLSDRLTVISFAYRHGRVWETWNKWDDLIGGLEVNWFYLNSFCKSYGNLTEHAKICCYGTHFLLYQVLTKKSIFGVPMVELVYFLLTKLFDVYKDSYPTKIKFIFDTFFLIFTFFSVIVYLCTQLS